VPTLNLSAGPDTLRACQRCHSDGFKKVRDQSGSTTLEMASRTKVVCLWSIRLRKVIHLTDDADTMRVTHLVKSAYLCTAVCQQ